MKKAWPWTAAGAIFLALAASAVTAQGPQPPTRQRIYGSELMTQQERNEHRARIRSSRTQQEREHIRAEHHRRMQERAKARGLSLPDVPQGSAGGMGPGMGSGMGSGMGGGRR